MRFLSDACCRCPFGKGCRSDGGAVPANTRAGLGLDSVNGVEGGVRRGREACALPIVRSLTVPSQETNSNQFLSFPWKLTRQSILPPYGHL